jgi:hypothetical protein
MLLLALVLSATSTPSLPAPEDADRDVLCYANNASEAADARTAGDTDKFTKLLSHAMFFRGIGAERYQDGKVYAAKQSEAIEALSIYIKNDGRALLDSECDARMRVAMNTGA